MPDQEGNIKKILSSKITLFLLLLGFIWLIVNLVNVFYKKYELNKETQSLKAQIEQSQENNQEISKLLEYFGSQSFLEKEAREKLNLRKEGEEVVIIEPLKDATTTLGDAISPQDLAQAQRNQSKNLSQTESETKKELNIVKWFKYFFR
ncbi:MAG: septum formation initiator family protein [Candidatus Portnoybacteria bacterium]|nr:septum formation initiator family protein [Candidatus Portnoybacteria bacterium]